jgi:hypothetical protein
VEAITDHQRDVVEGRKYERMEETSCSIFSCVPLVVVAPLIIASAEFKLNCRHFQAHDISAFTRKKEKTEKIITFIIAVISSTELIVVGMDWDGYMFVRSFYCDDSMHA